MGRGMAHRTFETENGNLAVRRGTSEDGTELVRSPRHRVDWDWTTLASVKWRRNERGGRGGRTGCSMQRVLFDFRPSRAGGLLLLPDDHLTVVRTRREDMAKFWVRPGDLPHGASVSVGWVGV
jgi:hypothetical protein